MQILEILHEFGPKNGITNLLLTFSLCLTFCKLFETSLIEQTDMEKTFSIFILTNKYKSIL
jgi:hypothetical protein